MGLTQVSPTRLCGPGPKEKMVTSSPIGAVALAIASLKLENFEQKREKERAPSSLYFVQYNIYNI